MNGTELLADFRKTRSEDAFSDLVRRYTNLVYSVARRRLENDSQAQEVAQTVFIRLAKATPDIGGDAELVAWLHRTTVHASIDLWRAEVRRRAREEHAAAMEPDRTEDAPWNEIAPVLDEALNKLNDVERQAVLLRFFEKKSMRELGHAFGISEDAAKMRVSRALDRLRTQFSARGVTCSALALGGLLADHSVEAAPSGLVLALAGLQISATSGVGAGAGIGSVLLHAPRAKLVAGLMAAVLIGGVMLLWLHSRARSPFADAGQRVALGPVSQANGDTVLPAASINNSNAQNEPDPRKLLQGVARARQRITSGEIELQAARYEFDRPNEGTNITRLKAVFDGEKRRFESFAREYHFLALPDAGGEEAARRIREEGLSHEAAVRAGLLAPFESHHVAAYDGALLLDYGETDGKPFQTKIDDAAKGSATYLFDPRCLGIDISTFVTDTIETCLRRGAKTIQLVGNESVQGVPAWHVRVLLNMNMNADFWMEAANPTRVLKHAWNGSEVLSKYDENNPKDPIPLEVTTLFLHGTTGRNTAFSYSRLTRLSARFNVPVDPGSWTLPGLGMKTGTEVVDYRISRQIGYWTGAGLSDDLPRETASTNNLPDPAGMLALLDNEPGTPAALDAAKRIMLNTPSGPDVEKAAEVILREHLGSTNLLDLSQELERLRPACASNFLAALVEGNPDNAIRGNACFSLAALRKDAAEYGKNQPAAEEAEKLFARVISDFGQVTRNGTRLADLAKPELYELHRLAIGKPAPEIEGKDLDGRQLKLSDYRGKVVVLVFWGHCGGCRPEAPKLLELQQRLVEKPFAILGIYSDEKPEDAQAIAEQSGMTWPSFKDSRNGPISTIWKADSWPRLDVVDRKGVIRHRNVHLSLADAVERLLAE